MVYSRFEETPVWKKSRIFVGVVYKLLSTNQFLKKDYALSD